MFLLFLIIFTNVRLALRKGKNSWRWGLLTFLGYLAGETAGICFMLVVTPHKALTSGNDFIAFVELLQGDLLKGITVEAFGLGGGLAVRYLLQRTPAPSSPDSTDV